MTDPQLDRAFAELRKGSQASLFLMLVGVLFLLGSVYYAATRLRPLEQQVAQKKADVERLADEEAAAKQRIAALQHDYATLKARSEERRGGKECVSTCKSRGYPYHSKKKNKQKKITKLS